MKNVGKTRTSPSTAANFNSFRIPTILVDGEYKTGAAQRRPDLKFRLKIRGGGDGIRTHYLLDATEALYQVSYAPEWNSHRLAVDELPTKKFAGQRDQKIDPNIVRRTGPSIDMRAGPEHKPVPQSALLGYGPLRATSLAHGQDRHIDLGSRVVRRIPGVEAAGG